MALDKRKWIVIQEKEDFLGRKVEEEKEDQGSLHEAAAASKKYSPTLFILVSSLADFLLCPFNIGKCVPYNCQLPKKHYGI